MPLKQVGKCHGRLFLRENRCQFCLMLPARRLPGCRTTQRFARLLRLAHLQHNECRLGMIQPRC